MKKKIRTFWFSVRDHLNYFCFEFFQTNANNLCEPVHIHDIEETTCYQIVDNNELVIRRPVIPLVHIDKIQNCFPKRYDWQYTTYGERYQNHARIAKK